MDRRAEYGPFAVVQLSGSDDQRALRFSYAENMANSDLITKSGATKPTVRWIHADSTRELRVQGMLETQGHYSLRNIASANSS